MWPARWGGSFSKEPWGRLPPPMTNRIAITLFLLILAAAAADLWLGDGAALLFLTKKLADLIEYLAFWR